MNKIQNFVKSRMSTYSKTKTYSKEEFEKMVAGMQSRRSELGSSEAWLTCYEWAMTHKDEAKSMTKDALISTLQKECGVSEFVAKDCTNDIKDYVNSYSKSECPACHSTPCTCSAIATHSDDDELRVIKNDLIAMASKIGLDQDTFESVKSKIESSTKEDIIKMLDEEIESGKDSKDYADEVAKFKDFRSKLGTNCGDQKTYSRTFEDIRNDVIENARKEYERYPEEFEDIKEGILDSSKDELYSNMLSELEVAVDEDQIAFLKGVTDELKSIGAQKLYSKSQKTYSAMANLDLEFKGDLDALLKKYELSVNNLPKIGDNDTAEEFWEKCIKWADKVDENPEPALYDELVSLGKKYHVEVK